MQIPYKTETFFCVKIYNFELFSPFDTFIHNILIPFIQRNRVFPTHSDFEFPISLHAVRFCRPLIFHIINYVRLKNLSLKYQRFTASGCKDIGIRKFEFFGFKLQ